MSVQNFNPGENASLETVLAGKEAGTFFCFLQANQLGHFNPKYQPDRIIFGCIYNSTWKAQNLIQWIVHQKVSFFILSFPNSLSAAKS